MTAIKQTKINFDTHNGNCLAAAIASILDMPLHAVPKFEDLMGMGDPLAWQTHMSNLTLKQALLVEQH